MARHPNPAGTKTGNGKSRSGGIVNVNANRAPKRAPVKLAKMHPGVGNKSGR